MLKNDRRPILTFAAGRLYITENYICFHATFPPSTRWQLRWFYSCSAVALSFELENIKSMKKYRAMLVAPTGIEIALVDGTVYQFQSFVWVLLFCQFAPTRLSAARHREEAFSVINYLWKHVPVYIDVPDSEVNQLFKRRNSFFCFAEQKQKKLYAAVVQREETTPKEKAGSKHSSGGDVCRFGYFFF